MITSKQNSRIKYLTKLQQKKYRDKYNETIIEGYYALKFAIENNHPIKELYFCEELLRNKFDNHELISNFRNKDIPIQEISKSAYMKITEIYSPEGLLALAPKKSFKLKELPEANNPIYIVIESIEKLNSLGGVIRIAETAGATGVIVADERADIYNPAVIRSSLGAFFSINIAISSSEEAISWLKDKQIKILATTPHAKNNYTQINYKQGIAIAMGTEYLGLSKTWLNSADEKILIPMKGQVNSLSVSSTTAIITYEALRQRSL
jgi:TrmH family RNA methyltransferase